jgi:hypothetical protein
VLLWIGIPQEKAVCGNCALSTYFLSELLPGFILEPSEKPGIRASSMYHVFGIKEFI